MPLRILLVLLLLASFGIRAELTVPTADGDDIPVAVYAADGDTIILWLPSEFGPRPRGHELAQRLAATGIEVWAPDLHAAWFLPAGRYSLNDVEPDAIARLIDAAIADSSKRVFLMAAGRSVALALRGVRQWQQGRPKDSGRLGGLLAFGPRLFVRTPQGGEAAEYLPVARASNLPIYILQPVDSGGFWHIAEDVRQLEQGGAPVFLHRLSGVSDGFHTRSEFSEREAETTRRLPALLSSAIEQLTWHDGTPPMPAPMQGESLAPERPAGGSLLRPYPGERQALALALDTLRGRPVDLTRLRGKVVLVNFWATWCPPCVEEIPSLQRLYRQLKPRGLEILAVDVGETVETMEAFLADKPVDFPVLMDTDGDALRRWGIYAFPTTLVLDRRHRIRYAVFGAFDWSSQEVIDALAPLLEAGRQ